jgi:hypothetical protein
VSDEANKHALAHTDGRTLAVVIEPINRFRSPSPPQMFWGFDVTPVTDIAKKIKSGYETLQPIDSDPMLNFDERDLLELVEDTGFKNIHVTLEAETVRKDDLQWDVPAEDGGQSPNSDASRTAIGTDDRSCGNSPSGRVCRPRRAIRTMQFARGCAGSSAGKLL